MSDENNVSLYGENAITSGDISEHDIAMVRKAEGVEVRDGDDLIDIDVPDDDDEGDLPGGEQETPEVPAKETPKDAPKTTYPTDDPALAAQLAESDSAIAEVSQKFTAAGVDVNSLLETIRTSGLTPQVLEQADKAEVPRYVLKALYNERVTIETAAQQRAEAASAAAAEEVYAVAGGREGFAQLAEFAGANAPDLAEAFNEAAARGDVKTAKVLLKSIQQARTVKLGTANKQINGNPTKSASAVQGYSERQEMVKAMSDPRYGRDPKYTRSVEAKTAKSTFF